MILSAYELSKSIAHKLFTELFAAFTRCDYPYSSGILRWYGSDSSKLIKNVCKINQYQITTKHRNIYGESKNNSIFVHRVYEIRNNFQIKSRSFRSIPLTRKTQPKLYDIHIESVKTTSI